MKDKDKLTDAQIRPALFDYYETLGERLRIMEEFPLKERYQRKAHSRVDALLVWDGLTGFEIKSDRDSLARLPMQIKYYTRYCDSNYIVVGSKYLERVQEEVPENWGIIHAYRQEDGTVKLEFLREAIRAPRNRLRTQLKLLWRAELIAIVKKHGLGGVSTRNKAELSALLYQNLSEQELRREICETLMERDYTLYEEE